MKLTKEYWTNRYTENNIPWDAGAITTPIKTYIDQLSDKELKILIPGVGTGHELAYLYEKGFKNVYGLDISEEPINHFKNQNPISCPPINRSGLLAPYRYIRSNYRINFFLCITTRIKNFVCTP